MSSQQKELNKVLQYLREERAAAYREADTAKGRAKQDIHRARAVAMGDAAARLRPIVEDKGGES